MRAKAYIYLFLAITLWSLIPAISKLATYSIDINIYLFYSNLLSTIAVVPFIDKKDIFNRASVIRGAIFGFLGVYAYYLLLYNAYSLSKLAQDVIVIQYLWPTITTILAVIFLKERVSKTLLLAIFISFLAFLVNVTDGFKIVPKFENSTSITLAFLASISFAIYSILSKKLSSKSASNDIFYTFVFAYLYSAISLIVVKKVPIIPKDATIYMLINGLFINGISYLFWVWALKDIKASIASTFVLASPIIASFWVYLLIGESLKFSFFVSIILIIIASILILKKDR